MLLGTPDRPRLLPGTEGRHGFCPTGAVPGRDRWWLPDAKVEFEVLVALDRVLARGKATPPWYEKEGRLSGVMPRSV